MTAPFYLGSYITAEEYKAAPTALRTNNLVPGGDQATQDAELAGLISKASRKLDEWALQPLYATASTQNDEARIKDGDILLSAHQDRVKTVTSLSWGCRWTTLTTYTNPQVWIEENLVRATLSPSSGVTWQGSLNLYPPVAGRVFVQWSLVAGWATTVLAEAALSLDSQITVVNPAGIVGTSSGVAPTVLTLTDVDGVTKTMATVQSLSGNVVTLTGELGTAFGQGAGVAESEAIKPGAVLLTSHYIKERKGTGVVMQKQPQDAKADGPDEYAEAKEIAERYQRKGP